MLPRQTCGLYTHTLHLQDYPRGEKRLRDSIHGGELFQVVINNLVSNQNKLLTVQKKHSLTPTIIVECLAELSEPIWIPSSVMMVAVIRCLVLMRLQNCSLNSPDHASSFPATEYA